MPTVLSEDGFDMMIYTRDHPPPHVHGWKAEAEVIVNLGDEQTKPWVRGNNGASQKNERKALRIVSEHQDFLLQEWERIHGKNNG